MTDHLSVIRQPESVLLEKEDLIIMLAENLVAVARQNGPVCFIMERLPLAYQGTMFTDELVNALSQCHFDDDQVYVTVNGGTATVTVIAS